MNAKTQHLLLVLLSALLSVALVTGCDDDDGDDNGDTATDTGGDTGGDTDDDTEDDTEDDVDDDTEDDTAGDTDDDTAGDTDDDTAGDTDDDTSGDTEDDMMMAVGSVTADDQTLDDLSTLVPVTEVVSVGDGWIVIHEDDGSGGPGPVIGHAAVVDGTNADVVVALERPAADGETLHAMLHLEDPADGAYTFDGANGEDPPATDDAGNIIMDPFVVTVSADLPAVRLELSASGIVDFSWDGVEPSLYVDEVFPAGLGDEVELQLTPDWRYEIVNANPSTHPFQLIAEANGMPATDTVLLSEGATAGTLEGDATVDWTDDDAGTLQFTASTTLTTLVNAYRCGVHTADMRGEVTVAMP